MKMMRKIMVLLVVVLSTQACKKETSTADVDPLIGDWGYGASGYITRDNIDLTDDYPNLSVTFQEGTLNVTGGGDLFPVANDQWTYGNDMKTTIIRNSDNLEMEIEFVGNILLLRFTYTTYVTGGRIDEITGEYEIRLEKQ